MAKLPLQDIIDFFGEQIDELDKKVDELKAENKSIRQEVDYLKRQSRAPFARRQQSH